MLLLVCGVLNCYVIIVAAYVKYHEQWF
jgi:hypothetical protein